MKKSVWIKGLEIRKMTNKQLANYEFNVRITNPDEPSDHELLKQVAKNQASDHELLMELAKNQANDHKLLMELAKNQASDHELLKQLVEKVNNIEAKLKEHDQLFKDHGWIK